MSLNSKKNKNSVFMHIVFLNFRAITPIKIKQQFQGYIPILQNTKEIECYNCPYLKINISQFRLILLDHITYDQETNKKVRDKSKFTRKYFNPSCSDFKQAFIWNLQPLSTFLQFLPSTTFFYISVYYEKLTTKCSIYSKKLLSE